MYLICDDVNEKEFYKILDLKKRIPNLKINCFVMGKDKGDYLIKDWIEVGCHGYDHSYPPECERDNQEEYIIKSYELLKKYLPNKFGFRAPGFQITIKTEPILKKIGFWYIAHQSKIKTFKEDFIQEKIINTHIYDNSLEKIGENEFKFLSEGFNKYCYSC